MIIVLRTLGGGVALYVYSQLLKSAFENFMKSCPIGLVQNVEDALNDLITFIKDKTFR